MPNEQRCRNCQKLEGRVAELEKQVRELLKVVQTQKSRIESLEAELKQSRRQAHPFSKGQPKPNPKPPGRRRGEGHFSYRKPPAEVHHRVFAPLDTCPDCAGTVIAKKSHVSWQSDLPPVKLEVTEYQTESGWCAQCCQRKRSRGLGQIVTASGAAASGFGPRLCALGAKLKHEDGMSYRRISALLESLLQEPVSAGALACGSQRLARWLEREYQELVALLKQAASVHADETGWRIGTLSAWLWVFTNSEATVYTIEKEKGHQVILDILSEDFGGVLHSDRAKAYDHQKLADWSKQKCLSHLLRNLSSLESYQQGGAVRFARDVKRLLRSALKLAKKRSLLEPKVYAQRCRTLENKLDQLIAASRQFSVVENHKMAQSLRKQRTNLLRFLYDEHLEATNNRAERALRPAVLVRKTGRCNKTEPGAKAHAILSSIFSTLRQRGFNTYEGLSRLVSSPNLTLAQLTAPT